MRLIAKGCWVFFIGAAVILFSLAGYLILSATNSALATRMSQTITIAASLWSAIFIYHLVIGVLIWPFSKLGIVLGAKSQGVMLVVFVFVGAVLFVLSPVSALGWGPLTLAVAFRILVLPHFTSDDGDTPLVEEEDDPLADTRPMAAVT